MMTEQKEIELARQIQQLSRQYCDGDFNKGEYRRRRRSILQQCVDEPQSSYVELDLPQKPSSLASQNESLNRMTYLMVAVTIGVVVIMGYLVHSST